MISDKVLHKTSFRSNILVRTSECSLFMTKNKPRIGSRGKESSLIQMLHQTRMHQEELLQILVEGKTAHMLYVVM